LMKYDMNKPNAVLAHFQRTRI